MLILNFPSYHFRMQSKDNKAYIFCVVRKKFYLLTPEEWVRQHVIRFLTDVKGYDLAGIAVEVPLQLNRLDRRLDVLVYKQAQPHIIVECKRPNVKLSQGVFDQIARYNIALGSAYLMITNGLIHFFYQLDETHEQFLFLKDLPIATISDSS
ncbi:MAG: type I restriction enzyme HsdR N-terminal domain-containing protein [Flavobacteriales bacterium AspAUS03]